jgi:hypothetical protein
MTQYWIEQPNFAVEVFDEGGNLLEVLARLHDLDAGRAAYAACRNKYPAKLVMLCQGRHCSGATGTISGAHVERSNNHNCFTSFLHVALVEKAPLNLIASAAASNLSGIGSRERLDVVQRERACC